MTELTCQQCQELAAELALDALAGDQRAQAMAHLAGCATCRDTVSPLVAIADRLLELLPDVARPAGFDQRVITALRSLSRPAPSRHLILIPTRPLTSPAGLSHGPGRNPPAGAVAVGQAPDTSVQSTPGAAAAVTTPASCLYPPPIRLAASTSSTHPRIRLSRTERESHPRLHVKAGRIG